MNRYNFKYFSLPHTGSVFVGRGCNMFGHAGNLTVNCVVDEYQGNMATICTCVIDYCNGASLVSYPPDTTGSATTLSDQATIVGLTIIALVKSVHVWKSA